jgi:penicillin amidase
VPTDGRDGECDWQGIIPYNDLPSAYNPESGIIVSANQNPFPDGYKYVVAGVFAPPYRAQQIRARLESKPKWTAGQMLSIQKDVYSPLLHSLARFAVKSASAKPPESEAAKQAVEELRKWNGQMEKGQAAPLIATLLYNELRRSMAEHAAAGSGDEYAARMAGPALERLLTERPSGWFADYDDWVMQSLAKAIEEGEKRQGSNIARWDYGQWISLDIQHPILGGLPFIGKYFNAGPVPMSGGSTSVKQISGRLGPSFRMIVDLANLDNSLANLTLGESGHFFSPHYKDQFDAYYNGTSFPMQFTNVKPEDMLAVKPF